MALTKAQLREILSKAGVDSEKMSEAVDSIIDGHKTSIEALREERDSYKADAEKLAATQKELDELQKTVAQNEKDPFKVKYEAVKEEFDNFKKDIENKENTRKKESAYSNLLKEAGVSEKRIASVLKVSDVDKLNFDKDGNLENKDDLVKSIKEEWSDFIQTTEVKGADTKKPPKNDGSKNITKDEIMQIKDGVERRKVMLENKELFGIGE